MDATDRRGGIGTSEIHEKGTPPPLSEHDKMKECFLPTQIPELPCSPVVAPETSDCGPSNELPTQANNQKTPSPSPRTDTEDAPPKLSVFPKGETSVVQEERKDDLPTTANNQEDTPPLARRHKRFFSCDIVSISPKGNVGGSRRIAAS